MVLPVLVLVVLAVVQAGTVARDAIAVAAAAREAARAAALGGDQRATRDAAVAAGGLDPQRVTVEVLDAGDDVRVVVRYRAPTEVPMVGPLVADVDLSSAVTMRRER